MVKELDEKIMTTELLEESDNNIDEENETYEDIDDKDSDDSDDNIDDFEFSEETSSENLELLQKTNEEKEHVDNYLTKKDPDMLVIEPEIPHIPLPTIITTPEKKEDITHVIIQQPEQLLSQPIQPQNKLEKKDDNPTVKPSDVIIIPEKPKVKTTKQVVITPKNNKLQLKTPNKMPIKKVNFNNNIEIIPAYQNNPAQIVSTAQTLFKNIKQKFHIPMETLYFILFILLVGIAFYTYDK